MNFDATVIHLIGQNIMLLLGIATLIGLPVAILITLALIRLFRRRVGRAMQATSAIAVDTVTGHGARPSAPTLPRGELTIERMQADGKLAETDRTVHVLDDARRLRSRLAAIYAGAACSFPFIMAGVLRVFLGEGIYAKEGLFISAASYGSYVLLFASPAVLAATMILSKQLRYLLLSLVMLAIFYGITTLSVQESPVLTRIMLALAPLAIIPALICLSYRPTILLLITISFCLVVVIWSSITEIPYQYDRYYSSFGGLWLSFVAVPCAVVLLLNVRRLRAVGPTVYAAATIFILAVLLSQLFTAASVVGSLGHVRFVREDLDQLGFMDAIAQLVQERISSLPEEEQLDAYIAFVQDAINDPYSIIHPDEKVRFSSYSWLRLIVFSLSGCLLSLALAWLFIRWLAKSYEKRRASDQMLIIDVMIIIFILLDLLVLAASVNGWITVVCALAIFAAYKLCSRWGLAWLRRSTPEARPRTLLLLRVFGFDSRAQRLLEDLGQRWRYLGPIRLIGGTDLANATIEPHEFFQFLNGRLSRAFVKGPSDFEPRLSRSAITADPDGTYRVEDFFCHDDTWRMTVVRLAGDADAILMDLRGFGPANQGCVYEIEQLLSSVPLDRVVLLVDRRTDVPFLERALQQAWRSMPDDSPNARAGYPHIRVLQASRWHRRTREALLGLLCQSFVEEAPSRSLAPILQGQPL